MNALSLAVVAFLFTISTTYVWFRGARRGRLPQNRMAIVLLWSTAVVLGIVSIALQPGLRVELFALFSSIASSFFLVTVAISKQKVSADAIKVGDTIPSFTSVDEHKQTFDSAELAGSPALIKFFRGHWCPYCAGELKRWEELRPEFDKYNVKIVTVSSETPAQIRKGRGKHGLKATMLADRSLKVTDLFGLRNKGVHTGPPKLFGGVDLPVPTALLVDPSGAVLWMDQSENYQQRTDPDYVLGALREHIG